MKFNIIFRADAGTQMGTGHVMRCLALAQAWQDAGGTACFATVDMPDGLAVRLAGEGVEVRRLETIPGSRDDGVRFAALARNLGGAWVVVDGYQFGAEYQRIIKEARLRMLTIDDYGHCQHYVADLVLNQNIYAEPRFYRSRDHYTRLLLGTQYVLLRREFKKCREWERESPRVARKVLVTMGGGDPDDVTMKIINALKQVTISGLEVRVVVGPANPNRSKLAQVVGCYSGFQLITGGANMPEIMRWADLAVSAAGSTCLELAYLGVPCLAVILSENQNLIAKALDAERIAINCGWHHRLSPEKLAVDIEGMITDERRLKEFSVRGKNLVDGFGAKRVIRYMDAY